jgi:hypothetical protein
VFVEVVPYEESAPEDGMLGAFAPEELDVPHPRFSEAGTFRLVQLKTDRIAKRLQKFDAEKTRQLIQRFVDECRAQVPSMPAPQQATGQLMQGSLSLLGDLKRLVSAVKDDQVLCMRRLTEIEAASEGALDQLRTALSAPRIILV